MIRQKNWKNGNNKKKSGLILFVLLSLLIHLLIVLLGKEIKWQNQSPPSQNKPVFVDLKTLPELQKEIVDIDQPQKEEVPTNAKAESLYNQKVKEETVAASPKDNQQKGGTEQTKKPDTPSKTESTTTTQNPTNSTPQKNFLPGFGNSEAPTTSGGDFLANYKIGNKTYINTDANPNIRYYVELKRKFRLRFSPASALSNSSLGGRSQISTVLGVTVNTRGELTNLIVIRSSGIAPYDKECLQTVKDSAPFSIPPTPLLDKENTLNMAWNFVTYL